MASTTIMLITDNIFFYNIPRYNSPRPEIPPALKGTVSTVQIDVTSDEPVNAAAATVAATHGRLDILVNNAGIYTEKQPSRDALRDSLAVNVVGAVSVTDAFLPLLRKSASPRLVFVTYSMGSLTYPSDEKSRHYGPYADAYRASKAALNMLMVQYTGRLGREGIRVIGGDPGFRATGFTGDPESLRKMGVTEPEVGGDMITSVIKGARDPDVGRVCGADSVAAW